MKILVFLLCFISTSVLAGTLPAPTLAPGKFVYTIPSDFDPPAIGMRGIDDLNHTISTLHFPFYVVLVKTLPGGTNEDAAQAIDGLAEDWSRQSYDASVSQIFLLSYNPRKYRFLAGAKFKSELGFERDAHKPYTSIFERYAKGTPSDVKGGIIAMSKAVDEYLFDQTDPVRVAARNEAARKAAEVERVTIATDTLDREIFRLSNLLNETNYLPSNVSVYRDILKLGQDVKARVSDPSLMMQTAHKLSSVSAELEGTISYQKHEERIAILWYILKLMATLILFCGIAWSIIRHGKRYNRVKKVFQSTIGDWEIVVQHGMERYVDFYGERKSVLDIKNLAGKTKELFDATAKEVDDIYIGLKAMDSQINKCKIEASKGSFLFVAPFIQATRHIEEEFNFDTGQLNKDDLFGAETKIVKTNPPALYRDLANRFKNSRANWDKLVESINARMKSPDQLFPSAKYNNLIALATKYSIPNRWLSKHPLFDGNAYTVAESLRWLDPVSYMERIKEFIKIETEVEKTLMRLVACIESTGIDRINNISISGITLDPSDDPAITLRGAIERDSKIPEILKSAADVEAVEEYIGAVNDLYAKVKRQVEVINSSIANADRSVKAASANITKAEQTLSAAEKSADIAVKVHKDCKADVIINKGQLLMLDAISMRDQAAIDSNTNKFVSACRLAEDSINKSHKAEMAFGEAMEYIADLNQKKAEYERRLAQMEATRAKYQKNIKRYGRSSNLTVFNAPINNGAMDYAYMLAMMEAQEAEWKRQETHARQSYEAEERAAAARRASYNSSSSSGNDWGGGSSSSGSGWGGGGSSSSGGDW